MTVLIYTPVRRKFVSQSEKTNRLLKRKRILEFTTSTADEWRDLADDFLADGGRANHAYCMYQFKRHGGVIEPIAFEYIPPESEFELAGAPASQESETAA